MAASCRVCCSALIILLVAMVAASHWMVLRWTGQEDKAFVQSLEPMDQVVGDAKLDLPAFRMDHVLARRPMIINLNIPGKGPVFNSTEMLRLCGARNVSLVTSSMERVARDLLPYWLFRVGFQALTGERITEYIQRRKSYSLERLVLEMRGSDSKEPRKLPWLVMLASKFSATAAKYLLVIMIPVFSSLYLADAVIPHFCPELLRSPSAGVSTALQQMDKLHDATWLEPLIATVDSASRSRKTRTMKDIQPGEKEDCGLPSVFWGGSHSIYYPLHRDYANGDVLMYVLSGCKEVVVMEGKEATLTDRRITDYIEGLRMPGTTAFGIDVFNHHALPPGVAPGFQGMLLPGQVLYLPAEKRHAIRNLCPDTVSVVVRPWRVTVLQEIMEFAWEDHIR